MVKIAGIEYYLPDTILSNETIASRFPEWSTEKIAKKTGIRQRHISKSDEFASDLAINACELFFKTHSLNREEVDFILYCTQSPDYPFPATACIIQDRLNLPNHIGALDFNLGCSGYIYGLALGSSMVTSGLSKKLLLITSETITKYIGKKDKGNQTLFGDAAAVTLLEHVNNSASICGFTFGTDGSGMNSIIAKKDSKGHQFSNLPFDSDNGVLEMNGREVFDFAIKTIPSLVEETLLKANMNADEVDFYVFHQANAYMLKQIKKRLKIDDERFVIDMNEVGNTVASSIPIALKNLQNKGRIQEGSKLLLAGFGVGLSWGACIVTL
ncbi:ketoacyl-ACP synthase III [Flavobacteriaceae bacterium]|nr:ketoacyl-ACP synthase III [Flavobacteriaceae bacterium]